MALMRNDYTLDFAGEPVSASTTEVVRRQVNTNSARSGVRVQAQ